MYGGNSQRGCRKGKGSKKEVEHKNLHHQREGKRLSASGRLLQNSEQEFCFTGVERQLKYNCDQPLRSSCSFSMSIIQEESAWQYSKRGLIERKIAREGKQ